MVRRAAPEDGVHPIAILFTDVAPAAATRLHLFIDKLDQES